MIRLEKQQYEAVYQLYKGRTDFFPLIGAVLLDEQDGVVLVDDYPSVSQAYVEHSFGFAQIFGNPVERFEKEIEKYLFVEKQFAPMKIRLFGTSLPSFLASARAGAEKSIRQHFRLPGKLSRLCHELGDGNESLNVSSCLVDAANISVVDEVFQVVHRFWRTPDDFIKKSHAVIVMYKGKLASICYSAANADGYAEIDVMTVSDFRNLGLGKYAVIEFINQCLAQSLNPLWDCFTNNSGSMGLCQSIGFIPIAPAYPFFTIAKV